MSLKEKIIRNSTISQTASIKDSKVFGKKDMIRTSVPMVNVALGGSIEGGLTPGLTMLAGPSKNFKTGFSLLFLKAFLDKYPEGTVLFYDSEFGTPQQYFESFNIDLDRVVHSPVTDVEQLRIDIMRQLDLVERGDHLMIVVDSIGNLASRKEVEDTLNAKTVADMTRAKQMKSLFRMVTPHLTLKDIPLVVVNHTYKEIGLYPKDIVSGGTGAYYSADTIWILGRQQDKDGSDIKGYHFVINVEKSRYVKEKSKIPISISWDGGINKWSGLLECALEHGSVIKPKQGWYQVPGEEKSYREKQLINNGKFWIERFKNTDLNTFIEKKYQIGANVGLIENESEDISGGEQSSEDRTSEAE